MKNFFTDQLTIQESIISTLAWFSIMERPLSLKEIRQYLWRNRIEEHELLEILNTMLLKKTITCKEENAIAYYCLKREEQTFETYFKRQDHQKKLLKKAKKVSFILRFIPFISKVYICNSLAFGKACKKSDIDLFIITERGMMFLSRILITISFSIFRIRRHKNKVSEHFCLSFYTESNNINLKNIAIDHDIYLIYWIATLKLLYGNRYALIMKNNNKWIHDFLPNLNIKEDDAIFKLPVFLSWIIKFAIEIILRITFLAKILNKVTGIYQKIRANKKLKKLGEKSLNIVSNNMLKFHDNDKRAEYRDTWKKKLKEHIT